MSVDNSKQPLDPQVIEENPKLTAIKWDGKKIIIIRKNIRLHSLELIFLFCFFKKQKKK